MAQLWMATATATVRLNGDTRRFFPHAEVIDHAPGDYRCCRRWTKAGWIPTDNPCPDTTHDRIGCSAIVARANKRTPWLPPSAKATEFLLIIRAHGELARNIRDAEPNALWVLTGHLGTSLKRNGWVQWIEVLTITPTTEQAIRSRLCVPHIERTRAHTYSRDKQ